ncbi:ABC transporter permease [Terrarubrum flagellatum]|uniref:ABC transporter permease n=1 Tax=Terrirubrum flagellatum TaxID=2895980 RepID=UPI003145591B
MKLSSQSVSWLQVAPLGLVMFGMVMLPIMLMIVVSFLDYGYAQVFPALLWDSWAEIFESRITVDLYLKTFKFVLITWSLTLLLGFTVSYFIVFHIRTARWRTIFMMACAIPFWTSTLIRMISWIPFLGREGLINSLLMKLHVVSAPLDYLLYSEFSILLVYVHTMALMMIAPIANSMAKIEPSVIVAARDAGASEWRVITDIIIPLTKSGVALGSIFVITQVIGDYLVVKQMGGNQVQTVVGAISLELNAFQYPPAAAKSVLMLAIVLALVWTILRVVDIRKELAR